jgi:hypothetical protein
MHSPVWISFLCKLCQISFNATFLWPPRRRVVHNFTRIRPATQDPRQDTFILLTQALLLRIWLCPVKD